jgi:hypothetical protein
LIRSAIELLTRPVRRWRWERRREKTIRWRREESSHHTPSVPCAWKERDPKEVEQDVHRWTDWVRAFLRRLKSDLKKVNVVEASRKASLDPNWVNPLANDEDTNMAPVWGEPKEIRDAKRRARLKQVLRRKVPRAWEEGV